MFCFVLGWFLFLFVGFFFVGMLIFRGSLPNKSWKWNERIFEWNYQILFCVDRSVLLFTSNIYLLCKVEWSWFSLCYRSTNATLFAASIKQMGRTCFIFIIMFFSKKLKRFLGIQLSYGFLIIAQDAFNGKQLFYIFWSYMFISHLTFGFFL